MNPFCCVKLAKNVVMIRAQFPLNTDVDNMKCVVKKVNILGAAFGSFRGLFSYHPNSEEGIRDHSQQRINVTARSHFIEVCTHHYDAIP